METFANRTRSLEVVRFCSLPPRLPAERMCVFYLQEATLPRLLTDAALAGLQFFLQVAQSVGEQLLVQLVVVALLACEHELLLHPRHLVRSGQEITGVRPNCSSLCVFFSSSFLHVVSLRHTNTGARAQHEFYVSKQLKGMWAARPFHWGSDQGECAATMWGGGHAPLPPASSRSCDFCPVHSERCFRDAALPASPAVPSPSAPPAEP